MNVINLKYVLYRYEQFTQSKSRLSVSVDVNSVVGPGEPWHTYLRIDIRLTNGQASLIDIADSEVL